MHTIWNLFFYQPIYNTLIFLMDKVTLGDVGFAIILLTIIVKLILFPLTRKSIKTQIMMRRMEPELKEIKKNFPDREEQAKKTFELYKKYDTNPFSGFFVIIIQLPVIFALYYAFYKGLSLGSGPLYSFIHAPTILDNNFLGLVNLQTKSLILALLTGVSQFIQGYLATPVTTKPKVEVVTSKDASLAPTFQDQLSESMQTNVRYILPIFITFFAYKISAAIALYWMTSNIFTILQEWYIRRTVK
jgi:YidC/Oxa1 family membrane protein insertase